MTCLSHCSRATGQLQQLAVAGAAGAAAAAAAAAAAVVVVVEEASIDQQVSNTQQISAVNM